MAKLPEETKWEAGIYQIEQTDPVVGGPPDLAKGQGITNVPARQLANRTAWLKGQLEALQQALANIDVSADIQTAIDALIDDAPTALNTLKELAAAIGNDPKFAATIARQLGTKLTKDAEASVARLVSAGTISGKRAFLTDSVEIRAPKGRDAYIDFVSDGHTGDFDWRVVANRTEGHFDIYADSGSDPSIIGFNKDGTIYTRKYGPDLGFTGNLSESGYQKLPSGLIIQWAKTRPINSNYGEYTTTFPIVFPNDVFSIVSAPNVPRGGYEISSLNILARTRAGFTAKNMMAWRASYNFRNDYVAIGY